MGIQIVLVLFILFAESRVILRLRDKAITTGECLIWTAFWIVVGTIVVVPNLTSQAAQFLGVGRGADLAIYIALIILFYGTFRQMVRTQRMEADMTSLARNQALNAAEENKKHQA